MSSPCPEPAGLAILFVDTCMLPHTAAGFVQLLGILATYAYVLYTASTLISDGAELLLLVLSPGLVGGLILPVLGAVPDGAIVLFSGLGPADTVQEQLSVGVGTLAGSTIMLLTLPWAACAILGRVDLSPGRDKALFRSGLTRSREGLWANLTRTGIQTSSAVRPAALLMLATSLAYVILQVPATIFGGPSGTGGGGGAAIAKDEHWYALGGLLFACAGFVGYSAFSIASAGALERQRAAIVSARKAAVASRLLSMVTLLELERESDDATASGSSSSSMNLLHDSSTKKGASSAIIKELFDSFDHDKSGALDESEVKAMLTTLGVKYADNLSSLLDEFAAGREVVQLDEFAALITQLCTATVQGAAGGAEARGSSRRLVVLNDGRGEESAGGGGDAGSVSSDKEEEASQSEGGDDDAAGLTPSQIQRKAYVTLVCGVLLVTLFSDPMVDALSELATRINVPAFYVSFIITPVISNASEVLTSVVQSRKKSRTGLDITYTQLLGAACINNCFTLAVFLLILFVRNLEWSFTAEVAAVIVVEAAVAVLVLTSKNYVQPLWKALLAGALFPLSLVLVYVLKNSAAWD